MQRMRVGVAKDVLEPQRRPRKAEDEPRPRPGVAWHGLCPPNTPHFVRHVEFMVPDTFNGSKITRVLDDISVRLKTLEGKLAEATEAGMLPQAKFGYQPRPFREQLFQMTLRPELNLEWVA